MQTITIDMSAATTEQALKLAACIMSLQLNFTVTSDIVPDTAVPAAPPAKAHAKPRERKPRAPKADNGGSTALLAAVEQTDGSVSAITSRLGDSPSKVQRALKKLREAGTVFMHGERRFARYGTTTTQAAERSEAAQGKPS